jgi:hypothetical protein
MNLACEETYGDTPNMVARLVDGSWICYDQVSSCCGSVAVHNARTGAGNCTRATPLVLVGTWTGLINSAAN